MDAFYEESAANQNAKKGEKTYKILHYISLVFLTIGILIAAISLTFIPASLKLADWMGFFMIFSFALLFFMIWFILFRYKRRVNISFDYIFVSGELRIAKVFNVNKRKLLAVIDCEDIIQIGDAENPSFERLASAPDTKVVYLTQNEEPAEGKFFMYILANNNGKKMYLLECRELLLMNIMKFTRRTALETDYVMQEKKQKQ